MYRFSRGSFDLRLCAHTTGMRILSTQAACEFGGHLHVLLRAEASYRGAIRAAQHVVEDIGPQAAATSGGLLELSRIPVKHSEAAGFELMANQAGLALPLPLTMLDEGFPVIRLRDWATMLADKHLLHTLLGLRDRDFPREAAILKGFWQNFQQLYPGHSIFEKFEKTSIHPASTFRLMFHGDEGRGRRRQGFLVVNYHSALGRGTQDQIRAQTFKPYVKLALNFVGSSLTTRLLHCALPKKLYQEAGVFDAVLNSAVAEAEFMLTEGVVEPHSQRKVWFAVLNVCGDWSWLHKCGNLMRSYNNVAKRAGDQQGGICHRCCAGAPGVPWETLHERNPTWLTTTFSESAFTRVPAICRLPHVPGEEERLLAFDIFHCFHLGVGKSMVGSAAALLSQHHAGRNVDERFASLESDYFAWCRANKQPCGINKVNKETFSWIATTEYPQAGWYKASLTTSFCKFFEATLCGSDWNHEPMLQKAGEAFAAINACLAALYQETLFIPADRAVVIAENGLRFLRRLGWLAKEAVKQRRALWLLTPKAHALHHLFLEDMLKPALEGHKPLNVLLFSTQMDEDFVGKQSRVSRRTDPRTVSKRCLERFLVSSYAEYVKARYIIPRS